MFEESSVNKPENQEEFEALLNSLLPEVLFDLSKRSNNN